MGGERSQCAVSVGCSESWVRTATECLGFQLSVHVGEDGAELMGERGQHLDTPHYRLAQHSWMCDNYEFSTHFTFSSPTDAYTRQRCDARVTPNGSNHSFPTTQTADPHHLAG